MKYFAFFLSILFLGCIKDYQLGRINYYVEPKISPLLIDRAHIFANANISYDCGIFSDDTTIIFCYFADDSKPDSTGYRKQYINNLAYHANKSLFYDYSEFEKQLLRIKIKFWPYFAPDYTASYQFTYSLDDPLFR